jgi:colanic acid/amylovoran biosynthesis protein WcaK/AmsJ
MAFGLLPSNAERMLDEKIKGLLKNKDASRPLIGFNVSGLIYNDPLGASEKYGLKANYQEAVVGFLGRLLAGTTANILLISHVMDQPGHYESDLAACRDVAAKLGDRHAERILVAPANFDQSQVKWLISKMDWFCGTRMHSTIASLSSGVATSSISYSDKTLGVFEACGLGEAVLDPRFFDTDQIITSLLKIYADRERYKNILSSTLPNVMGQWHCQMKTLSTFIVATPANTLP